MNEVAPSVSSRPTSALAWIDHLKALGIVAVVLGHTKLHPKVLFGLYTFHMPLFFLLAGYLWNEKVMRGGLVDVWQRKIRHLLYYFLFFGLVGVLYRLAEVKVLGVETPMLDQLGSSLAALLYGSGSREPLPNLFPVSLWFFPALISGSLCAVAYLRWGSFKVSLAGIGACLVAGYLVRDRALPWELEGGFVAGALIGVGHLLRRYTPLSLSNRQKRWIGGGLLVVGLLLAVAAGGKMNFRVSEFHRWPLSLGGAVVIVAGLACWASLVPSLRLSTALSAASITIFPLHGILFRVADKYVEHRYGTNTYWLETNPVYCLGLSAISLAVLTALHPYLDALLKRVWGERKKGT